MTIEQKQSDIMTVVLKFCGTLESVKNPMEPQTVHKLAQKLRDDIKSTLFDGVRPECPHPGYDVIHINRKGWTCGICGNLLVPTALE